VKHLGTNFTRLPTIYWRATAFLKRRSVPRGLAVQGEGDVAAGPSGAITPAAMPLWSGRLKEAQAATELVNSMSSAERVKKLRAAG
jgi:hypothetical protein